MRVSGHPEYRDAGGFSAACYFRQSQALRRRVASQIKKALVHYGIDKEVLKTFSRPDPLTTSLQDWRKGRRSEIQAVNRYAIDILRKLEFRRLSTSGSLEIALDIERGVLEANPNNARALIEFDAKRGDRSSAPLS